MDSLDKTVKRLPEEIIDKLLSSNLRVTLKIDGTAVQVRSDSDGNLTFHTGTGVLTNLGPLMTDIDMLSGEYAPAVERLAGLSGWIKNTVLTFAASDEDLVLIGGTVNNELMTVEEVQELANALNVDTSPAIFEGTLDEVQKQAVLDWCRMSEDQKIEKLGSGSFCRFIVTLLTNSDPTEIPFVEDVDGVIKGFVFSFSNDSKIYMSDVLDPKFRKPVETPGISETPVEDIVQVFLDYFDKFGVVLDGETFLQRLEKNFQKVRNASSEIYNGLIQMISTRKNPGVYVKNSALSDEFKLELERNDLLARLFRLFLDIFGKPDREGVPAKQKKEVNKYIAKIKQ